MTWDGCEGLGDLEHRAPCQVLGPEVTCFSCHVIAQAATFLLLCLLLAAPDLLFQALSWLLVTCTCPCKSALSVSPVWSLSVYASCRHPLDWLPLPVLLPDLEEAGQKGQPGQCEEGGTLGSPGYLDSGWEQQPSEDRQVVNFNPIKKGKVKAQDIWDLVPVLPLCLSM